MKLFNTASSEAFLPGLTPSNEEVDPTSHHLDTPSAGWWVRRSAKQTINAAGQPIGYRHHLMHGRKVISSGVVVDFGRKVRLQADYQNTRDERAKNRVEPTSDTSQTSNDPVSRTINANHNSKQ